MNITKLSNIAATLLAIISFSSCTDYVCEPDNRHGDIQREIKVGEEAHLLYKGYTSSNTFVGTIVNDLSSNVSSYGFRATHAGTAILQNPNSKASYRIIVSPRNTKLIPGIVTDWNTPYTAIVTDKIKPEDEKRYNDYSVNGPEVNLHVTGNENIQSYTYTFANNTLTGVKFRFFLRAKTEELRQAEYKALISYLTDCFNTTDNTTYYNANTPAEASTIATISGPEPGQWLKEASTDPTTGLLKKTYTPVETTYLLTITKK